MTQEKLPQSSVSNTNINIQNTGPIVAIIAAGIIAATGNEGWGWFLFLAFIMWGI